MRIGRGNRITYRKPAAVPLCPQISHDLTWIRNQTAAILMIYALLMKSRDSVATGYGLDDRGVGVRISVGARIFSSLRRPDRFWGPPILLSNGNGGSFPRVKRPGREADHSPPTSAEVKKTWV
jgi:hypothetical protein